MENIIAKAEFWFKLYYNIIESFLEKPEICEMLLPELKYIFRIMSFPFLCNEEKEHFLFIKIIIPLLEKIKLNEIQIQNPNFEVKEENIPTNESCK